MYYVIQMGWIRVAWGAGDRSYRGPPHAIACLDRFREGEAIICFVSTWVIRAALGRLPRSSVMVPAVGLGGPGVFGSGRSRIGLLVLSLIPVPIRIVMAFAPAELGRTRDHHPPRADPRDH